MTENLLIKLSEGLRNLAEVLVDLSEQMEKDDAEYFDLVRKHAELEVRYEKLDAELEARCEKLDAELEARYEKLDAEFEARYEKLEKERERLEYDKIILRTKFRKIENEERYFLCIK